MLGIQMRPITSRLHRIPATLIGLVLLGAGLFPFAASAQGSEAMAAQVRLLPLSGEVTFAARVTQEASRLGSLDDAAWLSGVMASAAKNAGQKKALIIERAALLELLGQYGEAASAWEAAASTLPGTADATCLLSAAACRLAAGDSELAVGLATAVNFSSPDPRTAQLASLIFGWASLARGEHAVAAGIARTVLAGADPKIAVAALLLARASTDGAERVDYEQRLAAYVNRPEAVSTVPLLLFASSPTSGVRLLEESEPSATVPATEMSYYQVGAFRDEANAKLLIKKLQGLGLEPLLKYKPPKELFVVYVHAGSDASRTVLVLKDAGYEAWAIDGTP